MSACGGYGGIGYYHVSDMYIALFSHFIPCGVWEAVYILDGLLKNESDIQPDSARRHSGAIGAGLRPGPPAWHQPYLFR